MCFLFPMSRQCDPWGLGNSPSFVTDDGGGGGGGGADVSNFPECNPGGNSTTENKLNFISSHYTAALGEAQAIDPVTSSVTPEALATMFLQWSMWESGYNNATLWAQHVAQNNYFGEQVGWAGSVACPSSPNIPGNTKNACFPSGMGWAAELVNALNSVSSTTNTSYIDALQSALPGGSQAQALQAIANNGWNGSSTYGSQITGGVGVAPLINCAKQNGYIQQ
jgi:hypothetical protein